MHNSTSDRLNVTSQHDLAPAPEEIIARANERSARAWIKAFPPPMTTCTREQELEQLGLYRQLSCDLGVRALVIALANFLDVYRYAPGEAEITYRDLVVESYAQKLGELLGVDYRVIVAMVLA